MAGWRHYFTPWEKALWLGSVALVVGAYLAFDRGGGWNLGASLIGVTSLIFLAKGNPVGPLLSVAFSLLYGYISFRCAYYGEMITYLGMTAPMAVVAVVSWLRHPYDGDKAQVEVGTLDKGAWAVAFLLTAGVTVAFYFILGALGTANLLPSTLSIATSFLAIYLTYRRSPWYALAYGANDLVLILLWVLAARWDRAYLSVAACFVAFLANDLYGYWNWRRMEKQQGDEKKLLN